MKLALISDIHSNLHALTTALREIERHRVDAVYCLGDIVGYGADPGPCVDLVRRYCHGSVFGNHDAAVSSGTGIDALPRDGQVAAKHNRSHLTSAQVEFLQKLPLTLVVEDCTFVHATPRDPEDWVRFDALATVKDQFNYFETSFCFVGHTHVPAIVAERLGVFKVRPGNRYIVNVGSVGQPRDENPLLGFVIFNTDEPSHELIRIPYDIGGAAARIAEEGLPETLGRRLAKGM
jgi:diadenosine tetraphosphatase ApaH/serine/threonine PP2A family protein phosphatase